MSVPNGKGIFIWQGKNFAKGSVASAVNTCTEMGLTWVALKIGDRTDQRYASYPLDMINAVESFHAAKIAVWGWHYVYGGIYIGTNGAGVPYGATPVQEAEFATSEVARLDLDGYIIDAEKEWKVSFQRERALQFLRALNVSVPVALCSYRFPKLHPEFPWGEFLSSDVSIHMPQVYWAPGNSATDLNRSILELTALKNLPIVPVGRAYIGDGNPDPTPAEIDLFMKTAVQRNLPGCSFWALDFLALHAGGAARQKAIADFVWSGSTPPVVVPPTPTTPIPVGKAKVTAATLNVRAGADTTYKDIGDLIAGTEVYVFEIANVDWARIGLNAWIKTGAGYAEYTRF